MTLADPRQRIKVQLRQELSQLRGAAERIARLAGSRTDLRFEELEARMAEWLMKTIRAEAQRLIELSAEDTALRADLRALAEEILAATALSSPPAPANEPVAPSLPPNAKSTGGEVSGRPASAAQPPSPSEAVEHVMEPSRQAEPVCEPRPEPQPEPLHELTLGRSRPLRGGGLPGQESSSGSVGSGSDLDSLSSRCRRKAETARWAAECQRKM